MNYSRSYQAMRQSGQSGAIQTTYNETQQIRYKEDSFQVSTQQANWASTQLLGKVDEKDFMVVQRSKTYEKSEAERQHHYEELIQDNLRMREVIEQLKREVATYKSSSSTDVTILKKELQITQQELEACQKELMMLRSETELKSRTEIDKLMLELDQWKRKYAELEQKDKDNAEQLKQLAYYQNKLKLSELEAKKKFEKYQTVDLIQQQLNDQEALIEELRLEIQRWRDKYDASILESQEIRIKLSKNDQVNSLEADMEALIHELGQWKDRCKVLEARHQTSDEAKLLARIEQLNRLLGEKEQEMQRTRLTISQQMTQQMSQQQSSKLTQQQQQIADYENQLDQLRRQLEAAQSKIDQQNQEMEGFRLSANVYNSERFEEVEQEKWKLEIQIEQLEKDCDTFMLRIKELEDTYSELQIKYNEQNANYLRYKDIVESNSSKYKSVENLSKELQNIQQELEVWKNRYFQTEIRLKEYDQLRIEYDALLKQGNKSVTNVTTINIENDIQYIQLKRERDNYQRQIQELEMRIRELQTGSIRSSQDENLRRERDNYYRQVQELESRIRELQASSLKNSQDANLRRERDNYYRQIQELELRIKEFQSQQKQQQQQVKYIYDDQKIRELETKLQEYQSKVSIYETRIREFETRTKEYETRNTQSLIEKTVVMTDEPKIKELTEIIQQKNQKILELEMNLNSNSLNASSVNTNTVLVIKEQVRTKEIKIRELETQIETLQLEIERLQNLKRDQDARINIMIQKITEYESQINILQEVKLRQSKRSPSQQQQITTSTTLIQQQQPIVQTTSYVQQSTTSKIYQQSQQNLTNPTPISQNYQYQPIQNNSTTTTKHVIITNDVEKNLYPKEDNLSSQIVDRIGSRDYTNYQVPQIIVSQYKPTN
ncbi:unnamed protein product [Paramecium sonneborni]|uniref:Uncharacterized protein n=1 Tax=Paramecium sonneborni TaxID=65129 RepID=A0A8S1MVH8_9CILI|nr:unnamed protein product [Paramecium sonneborni]